MIYATAYLSDAAWQIPAMVRSPWMQVLSVMLLVLYAVMLHEFPEAAAETVKELKSAGQPVDSRSLNSRRRMMFSMLSVAAGILALAASVTHWLAANMPSADFPGTMCIIAAATASAVILYQTVLLRLTGAAVFRQQQAEALLRLKRVCFSLAALCITPVLLLYGSMRPQWDAAFMYIAVSEAVIISGVFLFSSLRLFMSQKISILYWFLYLCTVELLPISLTVTILMRFT